MKTKLDLKNTNPRYWEQQLEKEGLGLRQLSLHEDSDNGDEPLVLTPTTLHKVTTDSNKDKAQLRQKIDKNDQFFQGHGIKKNRVNARKTPVWAMSDDDIRTIIETAFPNWRNNDRQRFRAARWVRVIYLFYRVGLSRTQVSKEMKVKPDTIKNFLKRIRRTAGGMRSDNTGVRKSRMTPSKLLL